jgi:NADH:ubiquinone reductase (H+-translocating)
MVRGIPGPGVSQTLHRFWHEIVPGQVPLFALRSLLTRKRPDRAIPSSRPYRFGYIRAVSSRRVVIVGAGLAGLFMARALDRLAAIRSARSLEVTLVSPHTTATLSPLLGGVLSGRLEPWQAHVPLRGAVKHAKVVLARATQLDPARHRLWLEGPGVQTGCDPGHLDFDDLVLACGTCTDHRGVAGAQERALSFLSVDDALRIRNRVGELLEAACGEDSSRRRRAIASVLVQGSDARACAAALQVARRFKRIAPWFGRIEPADPRVVLAAGEPNLVGAWGEKASRSVRAMLDRAGVEVLHNARVESVCDDHVVVHTDDGTQRLEARTVIWTDAASPVLAVARWTEAPLQGGRLRVDELLRVAGTENVYALGECAAGSPGTQPTPARIARAAQWLAKSMEAKLESRAMRSLAPSPRIEAMMLGDEGLARIGGRIVTGIVTGPIAAWLAKRSVSGLAARSGETDPARLQPSHQPLYLTPPPSGTH